MKKIYHYHPVYKYYLYEDEAEPSPLDPPGVWLIPAHSTDIEPPEYSEGFIAVFENENWSVIKDMRGEYYDKDTLQKVINTNPCNCPENCTCEVPPEIPQGKRLKWDNGWIFEDIPQPPTLTPQEKLQKLGLSIDDLRELLGLV